MAEDKKIVFPAGTDLDKVFETIEKAQELNALKAVESLIGFVQQVAEGSVKGDKNLIDAMETLSKNIYQHFDVQNKVINSLTTRVNQLELLVGELAKTRQSTVN